MMPKLTALEEQTGHKVVVFIGHTFLLIVGGINRTVPEWDSIKKDNAELAPCCQTGSSHLKCTYINWVSIFFKIASQKEFQEQKRC